MSSSAPGALWVPIPGEESQPQRVCAQSPRGRAFFTHPSLRGEEVAVEAGSPPRQPSSPRPSWFRPTCPPTPVPRGPARPGLARHWRGWHLRPGVQAPVSAEASAASPPRAPTLQRLSAPILMPVCLSLVSVPGLPGPAPGRLGLGVQPPPAAHAAPHLPGGGPLLHQQAQARRVAGTLEEGGEEPSGLCPNRSPHYWKTGS